MALVRPMSASALARRGGRRTWGCVGVGAGAIASIAPSSCAVTRGAQCRQFKFLFMGILAVVTVLQTLVERCQFPLENQSLDDAKVVVLWSSVYAVGDQASTVNLIGFDVLCTCISHFLLAVDVLLYFFFVGGCGLCVVCGLR